MIFDTKTPETPPTPPSYIYWKNLAKAIRTLQKAKVALEGLEKVQIFLGVIVTDPLAREIEREVRESIKGLVAIVGE